MATEETVNATTTNESELTIDCGEEREPSQMGVPGSGVSGDESFNQRKLVAQVVEMEGAREDLHLRICPWTRIAHPRIGH